MEMTTGSKMVMSNCPFRKKIKGDRLIFPKIDWKIRILKINIILSVIKAMKNESNRNQSSNLNLYLLYQTRNLLLEVLNRQWSWTSLAVVWIRIQLIIRLCCSLLRWNILPMRKELKVSSIRLGIGSWSKIIPPWFDHLIIKMTKANLMSLGIIKFNIRNKSI